MFYFSRDRYLIEDVENSRAYYAGTQESALTKVSQIYKITSSKHIRMTDTKAGTWTDYKLQDFYPQRGIRPWNSKTY